MSVRVFNVKVTNRNTGRTRREIWEVVEQDPLPDKEFGDWLSLQLTKKKVSKRKLARLSGLSPAWISLVTRGRKIIGSRARFQIEEVLKDLEKEVDDGKK